tara:strand:- start:4450 stop:5979 length:1530 start_codon:yes stop_codon:yes gene_type:complete
LSLPDHRSAGVCLHLTSLPGNHGIGELGPSARRFIDFLARSGLSIWQFLPVGPTAYGDSPYQPLSINAGNTLLIDTEALCALGLLTDAEVASLTRLPADTVDFAALIPTKSNLLSLAAARFPRCASAAMQQAFGRFCSDNDERWLHDFALFQVLKTRHQQAAWPAWEAKFRDRDAAALADIARDEKPRIDETKVLQFLFAEQWQALQRYAHDNGVRLFGDLPIYIALDSVDAWAHRELLLLDDEGHPLQVAGVPPDYFSADGQLWGNPIYDWAYQERTGFKWWIGRMQSAIELCDIVRIDHFRGFESYWSVPADAETARTGEWCKGPADRIFTAMRAELGTLPIVAEDLGIITEDVNALRERQNFPGMKVLQFLLEEPGFSADAIPENCVCYTGTHDNDTSAGWLATTTVPPGEIKAAIMAATAYPAGAEAKPTAQDLVQLAFASPARIAIAPMQDFLNLGTEARFNIPGTTTNNWRWRMRHDALTGELSATIRGWVSAADRCKNAVLQ